MSVIRKPQRNPQSGVTDADILAFAAGLVARGGSPTGEAVALEFGVSEWTARTRIRRMRARGDWPYPPCVKRPGGAYPVAQRRPRSGLADADVLAAAEMLAARGLPASGTLVAVELGISLASAQHRIGRLRAAGEWPFPPAPQGRRRP